jgi:hypothetical protein
MSNFDELYTTSLLVDTFHLTLDQIGELTDYQIAQLYFRPRKKTGEIIKPSREERLKHRRAKRVLEKAPIEKTRQQEYSEGYAAIYNAYQLKLMTEADYNVGIEKLQQKFADVILLLPKRQDTAATPKVNSMDETLAILKHHLDVRLISVEEYNMAVAKVQLAL